MQSTVEGLLPPHLHCNDSPPTQPTDHASSEHQTHAYTPHTNLNICQCSQQWKGHPTAPLAPHLQGQPPTVANRLYPKHQSHQHHTQSPNTPNNVAHPGAILNRRASIFAIASGSVTVPGAGRQWGARCCSPLPAALAAAAACARPSSSIPTCTVPVTIHWLRRHPSCCCRCCCCRCCFSTLPLLFPYACLLLPPASHPLLPLLLLPRMICNPGCLACGFQLCQCLEACCCSCSTQASCSLCSLWGEGRYIQSEAAQPRQRGTQSG